MDDVSRVVRPESLASTHNGFLDFFRCPPEFARFQTSEEPCSEEGFFRFGQAICYGKSSAGQLARTPRQTLFDASWATESDQSRISLCFDPTQAAENLRREHYLLASGGQRLLRSLYYLARPALAFPLRKSIQRLVLSRRLSKSFPCWPVDCSVEHIFELLMELVLRGEEGREVPFIWFWPEGHTAALMMTHDVEDELGATHCDMLMDLDDSVGLKAAFQLVPEVRYQCFEKLIADIRARGFETNLHDLDHDGRLYEDLGRFRKRAARINEYAKKYHLNGFRAGAMHRNQDWFELLEFQYEMSVPNVAHLEPQEGGCCSVMPYFVGNLLELPLTTVQDYALFYILEEQSIDLWKRQIETICSHQGLISFIVHPDYIVRSKERSLYRQLLRHLADLRNERDIWWALPGEINLWWRQRSKLQLVNRGNRWDIEGSGSERAKLAFARVEDGKLRYRIAGATEIESRAIGNGRMETGKEPI
jgi:hypothetical protein